MPERAGRHDRVEVVDREQPDDRRPVDDLLHRERAHREVLVRRAHRQQQASPLLHCGAWRFRGHLLYRRGGVGGRAHGRPPLSVTNPNCSARCTACARAFTPKASMAESM